MATGERQVCLITLLGSLLKCVKVPSAPLAPPTIADFDGDGVPDIIITRRGSM